MKDPADRVLALRLLLQRGYFPFHLAQKRMDPSYLHVCGVVQLDYDLHLVELQERV